MKKDLPLTPGRAVFQGHLVATLPALLLLVAVFILGARWIAQPLLSPPHSYSAYWMRLGIVSISALAVGWLWWAVAILRWRAWVKERAVDERETERLGQRTLLLWPKRAMGGD
jgi:membrane-associated phospholipid phosphatase